MRLIGFLFFFTTGGCASTPTMPPTTNTIHIDKGTVYVHINDKPTAQPYKINYRAQGECEPEVEIKSDGARTEAIHIKDCHGKGRNEGTIFDIWLNGDIDYSISLKAGQIFSPGVRKAPAISKINASVAVGGIHGGGSETKSSRKLLLGAVAETTNSENSDGMTLVLKVNMGGIDIVN